MQDMPEITDVDTDLQPGGLEADLIVDRDSASRLGLTEIQIDNALGDAFAQAQVSNIYNPFSPQQYHVVMEVAPEFWQHPEVLQGTVRQHLRRRRQRHAGDAGGRRHHAAHSSSRARPPAPRSPRTWRAIWRRTRWRTRGGGNTSTGSAVSVAQETVVPFSAFSHFTTDTTPVSVNHTGTSVSTSIAFNLPEGESIGTALAAIDRKMSEIHMPVSIRGGTYGTAKLFQQSNSNTPLMLSGGAGGDLRGARRAVRELQPAADHSLDPAVRRRRRTAGADGHRHRIQPHRLSGHPAADRHRQEKRHHDGGLRARGRADPRDGSARKRSRTPARCASGRS